MMQYIRHFDNHIKGLNDPKYKMKLKKRKKKMKQRRSSKKLPNLKAASVASSESGME